MCASYRNVIKLTFCQSKNRFYIFYYILEFWNYFNALILDEAEAWSVSKEASQPGADCARLGRAISLLRTTYRRKQ